MPGSALTSPSHRHRAGYGLALGLVVLAGLASRRYPGMFPVVLGNSPGDALWALAVFLVLGMLFPAASIARIGAAALLIAFAVEFSQLSRASWLTVIRGTVPGRLLLGTTFVWADLPAYAAGVAIGMLAECAGRVFPCRCGGGGRSEGRK